MSIKKIEQKLLEGFLPAKMRMGEITTILSYYGWKIKDTHGSHMIFTKGEEIKTIITEHGRIVMRYYLGRVKENIIKCKTGGF